MAKTIKVLRHKNVKPGMVLRFSDDSTMLVKDNGSYIRVTPDGQGNFVVTPKLNKKQRRKLREASK